MLKHPQHKKVNIFCVYSMPNICECDDEKISMMYTDVKIGWKSFVDP